MFNLPFGNSSTNLEDLISKFNQIMASTNELNILTEQIVLTLMAELKISKAAFLFVRDHQYIDVAGIGYNKEALLDSNLLEELLHDNKQTEEMQALYKKLDIEYAIPLVVKDSEVGLLLTGPKISGTYSETEKKLLNLIAPQLAIAVNNAWQFKEIKKFNEILASRIEQTKNELELSNKEKLEKAEDLIKLKNEFVFIATHDLKTPVAAIKGFIEMMKKKTDQLPEDMKKDFEMIDDASKRLVQLADDLLEVARSESGTMKINIQPVKANNIIEDSINQVRPSANDKKVLINSNLDSNDQVMADPEKLQEIVENLLSNAVKYNKEGGKVDITTKTDIQKKQLIFMVADTGLGIPAVDQSKMFTKFFRGHQRGAEGVSGTGLGLYVVKLLIEKMKGEISFESKENVGTTFKFTLPLVG